MPLSVSIPGDLLPIVDEVAEDYGSPSRFVQVALEQYARAKGQAGRRPQDEQLGVGLLRAKVEQDRIESQMRAMSAERLERRIEEYETEQQQRTAADATSQRFTSPEDLVRVYWTRVVNPAAEGSDVAWRNLAQKHGFPSRDVLAVVARHASQTHLPRASPPLPSKSMRRRGLPQARGGDPK